jgi:hypothetical protein
LSSVPYARPSCWATTGLIPVVTPSTTVPPLRFIITASPISDDAGMPDGMRTHHDALPVLVVPDSRHEARVAKAESTMLRFDRFGLIYCDAPDRSTVMCCWKSVDVAMVAELVTLIGMYAMVATSSLQNGNPDLLTTTCPEDVTSGG